MATIRDNTFYNRVVKYRQVTMPAWLCLVASPTALKLHAVMDMHLVAEIQPAEGTLAHLVGLEDDAALAPYFRELEGLGAIHTLVDADGMVNRILNTGPPDGYTGLRTLLEYYEERGPTRRYGNYLIEEIRFDSEPQEGQR